MPIGTVDKFQGREAAMVFFSMATSSGADMARGMDFLFSRNGLNVAISRARCLAYLVCTDELLDARAHTVEEMRMNAFVETALQLEAASLGEIRYQFGSAPAVRATDRHTAGGPSWRG